jgi:putative membrane protein
VTVETTTGDEKHAGDPALLRERLAAMRTLMANERTVLAYVRTSLALLIAGFSGLHLLEPLFWKVVSWVFIVFGLAVFAVGVFRFAICRRVLRAMDGDGEAGPGTDA